MNPTGPTRALTLSTVAFAVSFALWGMIAPMAKTFQAEFHLSEQQIWLVIALPILLGSIGRLPMGMLADRIGGRVVFGGLLIASGVPAFMLSRASSYSDLVLWGLALGVAGTSFSVGVAFVSRWFPPERQGLALGVFGVGNGGQSVALFGVPVLAALLGGRGEVYRAFAIASVLYGVLFLLVARDAPRRAAPRSLADMVGVLRRAPLAWLFSLFYFVTFGAFVALGVSLPKLLQTLFAITKEQAGLRVAVLVLVATAMRPVGGWLSDRVGGSKVLSFVFALAGLFALGMTSDNQVLFTGSAYLVAAIVGLGNGAVFKLVPQYFGSDTGTVTGLVGAMGGLGGFFPPLALGYIKGWRGSYDLGFVLLTAFCAVCLAANIIILVRPRGATDAATAPSAEIG